MSPPEPAAPRRLTIAAIGDVGLVGSGRRRAARDGWEAPFAALAPRLAAADVAFANLEFPVGEPAWVKPGRSAEFFHDAEVPAALARAGVRVVSLANNHMMDCGPRGLARTREACHAAGLLTMGAGGTLAGAREPARLVIAGQRTVWLAYATATADAATAERPGVAPLDAALITEDLERWRPEADVLVVSAHWGSMYVDYPPPRVRELAELLAEHGADLVLGHHPHVLQGIEQRGRATVLYSLGDAVFNAKAGDFHAEVGALARLESAVITVRFSEGAPRVDVAPMRLDADGYPGEPEPGEKAAQERRLAGLSAGLADAARRFALESAPSLLQYELQSLGTYVRQGRWDRVAKLLGSVRPRHLPLLWQAVSSRWKKRRTPA